MQKNKKSYTKEFKFKVALEMIKGDLSIPEISARYQVPRSVASRWKTQLISDGVSIFANDKRTDSSENIIEKLHATIGELKVENDFLLTASHKLKL